MSVIVRGFSGVRESCMHVCGDSLPLATRTSESETKSVKPTPPARTCDRLCAGRPPSAHQSVDVNAYSRTAALTNPANPLTQFTRTLKLSSSLRNAVSTGRAEAERAGMSSPADMSDIVHGQASWVGSCGPGCSWRRLVGVTGRFRIACSSGPLRRGDLFGTRTKLQAKPPTSAPVASEAARRGAARRFFCIF